MLSEVDPYSAIFLQIQSNTTKGILVECDPSIKAIIIKLDSERNDFIVEDLDDTHLVINEGMLPTLKMRLEDVSLNCSGLGA